MCSPDTANVEEKSHSIHSLQLQACSEAIEAMKKREGSPLPFPGLRYVLVSLCSPCMSAAWAFYATHGI